MGRRAVAATLVSVIFFSTLLGASLAVYAAGSTSVSSAALASAQERESGYAGVLFGLASFSSLSATEVYLQAHPVGCSTEASYAALLADSVTSAGAYEGIQYSASSGWAYSPGDPHLEGLASIAPFDGYSSGALNLVVDTKVDETLLGGLPTYSVEEEQVVHLPIAFEGLVSQCLSVLALMRDSLSSIKACSSSAVQEALDGLDVGGAGSLDLGASPQASGDTCSIYYWVRITQSYEGVSGPSQWSVFGSQSLSTTI